MNLITAVTNIHWLAVLVAAASAFLVGGIWYGPVFGRAWMTVFRFTEDDLKKRNATKTFGGSFFLSLVAAVTLAMFVGPKAGAFFGAMAGLLAGLGWVTTFLGILYLFEMQSWRAWLINAGYCTVALTLMGAILGLL